MFLTADAFDQRSTIPRCVFLFKLNLFIQEKKNNLTFYVGSAALSSIHTTWGRQYFTRFAGNNISCCWVSRAAGFFASSPLFSFSLNATHPRLGASSPPP